MTSLSTNWGRVDWNGQHDGHPYEYGDQYWRAKPCANQPGFREHLLRCVDKAIEIGSDGIWIDNLQSDGCYGARCQEIFRAYVQANVKDPWHDLGLRPEQLAGLTIPRAVRPRDPLFQLWIRCRVEEVRTSLEMLCTRARSQKLDVVMAANIGIGNHQKHVLENANWHSMLELLDFTYAENGLFPAWTGEKIVSQQYTYSIANAVGTRIVPGVGVGAGSRGLPRPALPGERALRRCLAESAMFGGHALGGPWGLRGENGGEDPILLRDAAWRQLNRRFTDFYRERWSLFGAAVDASPVAILYNFESLLADEPAYRRSYEAMAQALMQHQIPFRYVLSDRLEKLDDVKVLVMPHVLRLAAQTETAIRAWVKRGGRILVDLSFGIQLADRREEVITLSDDDLQPPDCIPVLGAREVTPNGLVPSSRHWVKPSDVADDSLVQAGDLLLRRFVADGSRGPRLCVAVVPPGLQAAFSSNILRVRWKPNVPPHAQQLLVSWLTSNRASDALAARGVRLQLLGSVLSEVEVPYPHESLLTALGELAKLEGWYTERKDAVRLARQEIFESNEYAVSVPALMLARQSERERVAAADDSQGVGYKVRNYYPHPIALRREQLLVQPHGGDRLKATLECAEHLVHLVALCGVLQLKHVYPDQEIPSSHLRAKLAMGRLTFDWGTSWSIIQEAVASTSKHVDSLALPFPQLKLIEEVNNSDVTDLTQAESRLREWRNNESHLARLPDAELSKMSAEFMQRLDCLLSAMSVMSVDGRKSLCSTGSRRVLSPMSRWRRDIPGCSLKVRPISPSSLSAQQTQGDEKAALRRSANKSIQAMLDSAPDARWNGIRRRGTTSLSTHLSAVEWATAAQGRVDRDERGSPNTRLRLANSPNLNRNVA